MSANAKELLELLINNETGTKREKFDEKISTLLTKFSSVGIAATANPIFPISMMTGMFFVLPSTKLMSKLNLEHIYIKKLSPPNVSLKVVVILKNNNQRSIQFYSFTSVLEPKAPNSWLAQERDSFMESLDLSPDSLEQLKNNVRSENYHFKKNSKATGPFILTKFIPTHSESNKVNRVDLSQFTKIQTSTGSSQVNLEELLKDFSNNSIDKVKESAVVLCTRLVNEYQSCKKEINLSKLEVGVHGFFTGVLEGLRKGNNLDVVAELTTNLGRADLLIIARGTKRNIESIPIIIEFKVGKIVTAEAAIAQIKNKYLDGAGRMRTIAEKGVIVGINPDATPQIVSEISELLITQNHYIKDLIDKVETVLNDLTLNDFKEKSSKITEIFKAILNKINTSRSTSGSSRGSDIEQYVQLYLLGEAMSSMQTLTQLKQINYLDGTLSLMIASKEDVTLHLDYTKAKTELTGGHVAKSGTIAILNSDSDSKFEFINDAGKPNFKAIQRALQSLDSKEVFLITSEGNLQAFTRGCLSGALAQVVAEAGQEILAKVFEESAHAGGKRADLVFAFGNTLEFIELKFYSNNLLIVDLQNKLKAVSKTQTEGYLLNAKSISHAKEATLVTVGYSKHLRKLDYIEKTSEVDHTSESDLGNSPTKKGDIGSPMKPTGKGILPSDPFEERSPNLPPPAPPIDAGYEAGPENTPEKKDVPKPPISNTNKRGNPETDSGPNKKRCKRNLGGCVEEGSNYQETIKELLDARKNGDVILVADEFALLTLMSLKDSPASFGKLILISETLEALDVIHSVMTLVQRFRNMDTWLGAVKMDFPTEGAFLEHNKEMIEFSRLENIFTHNKKIQFKVISPLSRLEPSGYVTQDKYNLGISDAGVSAIYISPRPLNKNIEERLFNQLNGFPKVYKKYESGSIQRYQGPLNDLKSKLNEFEQEKNNRNDHLLGEALLIQGMANECFASIKLALENFGIVNEDDWIPILKSIEPQETHIQSSEQEKSLQISCVNKLTGEIRVIPLQYPEPIIKFSNRVHDVQKKVKLTHKQDPSGVNTLDSAFLIQTLILWGEKKGKQQNEDSSVTNSSDNPLSLAITIDNYLGFGQSVHGVVSSVADTVSLVKSLVLEQQKDMLKKSLFKFSKQWGVRFFKALGPLSDVVSLSVNIWMFAESETEADKTTYGIRIATSSLSLTVSGGAAIASIAGASTVAGILGPAAVILTGISIGLDALVSEQLRIIAKAQEVGNYFYTIDNGFKEGGYQKQEMKGGTSMMAPLPHSVVTEINFSEGTLLFGGPYLYSSSAVSSGSGKRNFVAAVWHFPKCNYEKEKAFNVLQRLFPSEDPSKILVQNMTTGLKETKLIVLPHTPNSYISYKWGPVIFTTGRNDAGYQILRKLEGPDFHYDFYIFPVENTFISIEHEFQSTPIKIVLDSKSRELMVPTYNTDEKFIAKFLEYTLEGPATTGQTILHLDEVGSLTIESKHADYKWIFILNSTVLDIQFFDDGVTLNGIALTILNPLQGHYYVKSIDETHKLNISNKNSIPQEINFKAMNPEDFNSSIQGNPTENFIAKINNFPVTNAQGRKYNVIAFYYSQEKYYAYTNDLPINLNVQIIGFLGELCFFWAPGAHLWSSNRDTHEIVKHYELGVKEIKAAFLTADGIQIQAKMEFEDKTDTSQTFERYITYKIKQDGELYLTDLADSNDHLLALKNEIPILGQFKSSLIHLAKQNWQEKVNVPEVGSQSDQSQEHEWKSGTQTHVSLSQVVSITPTTDTSYKPTWILSRHKHLLITGVLDAGISERNLEYLGSLLLNGREVFFFYRPEKVISSELVPAKIFIKSYTDNHARELDLDVVDAFRMNEHIFILTPDFLIKELDPLGQAYLQAVSVDWIKAHITNWWEEIPKLVNEQSADSEEILNIYGLQDNFGNPLSAKYDRKLNSFILSPTLLNEDNKPFAIHYLTTIRNETFFFCRNGVVYKGKSYVENDIKALFDQTQLRTVLLSTLMFSSIDKVYFQNDRQRWFIQTITGTLFSSRSLSDNIWQPESISEACFNQGKNGPNYAGDTRYKDHPQIGKAVSYFKALYNKDCMNEAEPSESSIRDRRRARDRGCGLDSFVGAKQCVAVNKNKPIPIMRGSAIFQVRWLWFKSESLTKWWLPKEEAYFSSTNKIETAHLIYLGFCRKSLEKDISKARIICFFDPEKQMIHFAQEPLGESQSLNSISVHAVRRFDNQLQLNLKAESLFSANAYSLPVFEEIRTIGLILERSKQDTSEDTPEVIYVPESLMHTKVMYASSKQNTTFVFSSLNEARDLKVEIKDNDIVVKHPDYPSFEWVFLNGKQADTFAKTSIHSASRGGYYTQPVSDPVSVSTIVDLLLPKQPCWSMRLPKDNCKLSIIHGKGESDFLEIKPDSDCGELASIRWPIGRIRDSDRRTFRILHYQDGPENTFCLNTTISLMDIVTKDATEYFPNKDENFISEVSINGLGTNPIDNLVSMQATCGFWKIYVQKGLIKINPDMVKLATRPEYVVRTLGTGMRTKLALKPNAVAIDYPSEEVSFRKNYGSLVFDINDRAVFLIETICSGVQGHQNSLEISTSNGTQAISDCNGLRTVQDKESCELHEAQSTYCFPDKCIDFPVPNANTQIEVGMGSNAFLLIRAIGLGPTYYRQKIWKFNPNEQVYIDFVNKGFGTAVCFSQSDPYRSCKEGGDQDPIAKIAFTGLRPQLEIRDIINFSTSPSASPGVWVVTPADISPLAESATVEISSSKAVKGGRWPGEPGGVYVSGEFIEDFSSVDSAQVVAPADDGDGWSTWLSSRRAYALGGGILFAALGLYISTAPYRRLTQNSMARNTNTAGTILASVALLGEVADTVAMTTVQSEVVNVEDMMSVEQASPRIQPTEDQVRPENDARDFTASGPDRMTVQSQTVNANEFSDQLNKTEEILVNPPLEKGSSLQDIFETFLRFMAIPQPILLFTIFSENNITLLNTTTELSVCGSEQLMAIKRLNYYGMQGNITTGHYKNSSGSESCSIKVKVKPLPINPLLAVTRSMCNTLFDPTVLTYIIWHLGYKKASHRMQFMAALLANPNPNPNPNSDSRDRQDKEEQKNSKKRKKKEKAAAAAKHKESKPLLSYDGDDESSTSCVKDIKSNDIKSNDIKSNAAVITKLITKFITKLTKFITDPYNFDDICNGYDGEDSLCNASAAAKRQTTHFLSYGSDDAASKADESSTSSVDERNVLRNKGLYEKNLGVLANRLLFFSQQDQPLTLPPPTSHSYRRGIP